MALLKAPNGSFVAVVSPHLAAATSPTPQKDKRVARREQLEQAMRAIDEWRSKYGTVAVIISGDLNDHWENVKPQGDWAVIGKTNYWPVAPIDWTVGQGATPVSAEQIKVGSRFFPFDHRAMRFRVRIE